MIKPLKILIVEDSEDDALLILHQVKKGGYNIDYKRIETPGEMKAALEEKMWDIILSDYSMPHFNGLEALKLLLDSDTDIPFIIISGTIGEELAVEAMKAGAHDYIMKNNMSRLVPVIEREIRESKIRTDRKLLEQKQKQAEALKMSEKKFRDLVSDMHVGVLLLNSSGEISVINNKTKELLELSEEQILDKNAYPPDWNAILEDGTQFQGFPTLFQKVILSGQPEYNFVIGVFHSRKNNPVWLYIDIVPQFNDHGKLFQIVCTLTDRTDRKKAIDDLRQSEQQYRQLIEMLPDAIAVHQQNKIAYINMSGTRLFGAQAPTELIGKSIFELVHPDYKSIANERVKKTLKGEKAQYIEEKFIKLDGSSFDVEVAAIPSFFEKKPATQVVVRDITKRKLIEAEVVKLTKAIEQCPVSIIITNTQGLIEYANPFCTKTTGYETIELKGKNPNIFNSGVMPGKLFNQLWDTINSGNIWRGEICNKKKNGELYWERVSISPLIDGLGKITHFIGVKEDITSLKNVSEALKESEKKYRVLFMDSPDAYLIVVDGIFVECNHAAEMMMGGARKQIIGHSPSDLSPEFQPSGKKSSVAAAEILNDTFSKNKNTFEWVHQRMDGTTFFVEVSAASIKLDEKLALFVSWRDITQRKQAEEQLAILNYSLNKVRESVFLSDIEGNFSFVNNEACNKLGYDQKELLKMNVGDVAGNYLKEKWHAHIHELKISGALTFESTHITKEKTLIPVEINENYFIYDKAEYILALARDITERKIAENEIKLKNEALVKLNNEKDMFFSIIAHDLRSPIASFMGITELLAENSSQFPAEKLQMVLTDMKNSANKIYRLLDNLLNWANIQQGLLRFEPQQVNLLKMVRESIEVMSDLAMNKNISIDYDVPSNLMVQVDINMFQSIIRNLISNAVKFTSRGGKIKIQSKTIDNRKIEISITDTGIGMNEKIIDNLFQLSARVNRPGTEGEPSTGLGLLLCKEFVEKNGGKLWAKSTDGVGTTLYFTVNGF